MTGVFDSRNGSQPNATSPPSKRDLKSWWKGFKLPSKQQEPHDNRPQGIFGVPLRQSITYANVAISLVDEDGQSYIYGYVPIVVAKCGVFLKEKATGIEGIFRLSGSEKRIKELKQVFDSPDRYGKGLVWDGYTVHDASNLLRRYLNDLPEPVVPLDLYQKFREPLKGATLQASGDADGPQLVENFDETAAIAKYQQLITELPPLNRQLLLYILDLLAVFAAKSDENRMTSQNLAAIFQPGMLSHPAHAMAPEEYRLNQCVIIFLIENQDHFLIGMQGTGTDEKTKQEIERGTPPLTGPTTPTISRRSGLGRSASNASAGADSVMRDGKLRRNRSTSSRHSRHEGSTTPKSPGLTVGTPTGGLGRSNTVPSKKSPNLQSGRFHKADVSPLSSPKAPALHEIISPSSPQDQSHPTEKSPAPSSIVPAAVGVSSLAPGSVGSAGKSQERLLEPPQEISTPQRERNLQSIFQRSPSGEVDKRQPNKLKKKRLPSSVNPSAQSSSTSLHATHSPAVENANPMDASGSSVPENGHSVASRTSLDMSAEATPRVSQGPNNNTLYPDNAFRSQRSPPTSLHSSFNEESEAEHDLANHASTVESEKEKDKGGRWRIGRHRKDDASSSTQDVTSPRAGLGSNNNAEMSVTSVGSASNKPRKSFTGDSGDPVDIFQRLEEQNRDKEKDESKGPIGWIRNKYREAKETAEQRRNKSPPADSRQSTGLSASIMPTRGKSMEIRREEPPAAPAPAPEMPSLPQPPQPPQPPQQPQPAQQPQQTQQPHEQPQPSQQPEKQVSGEPAPAAPAAVAAPVPTPTEAAPAAEQPDESKQQ